VGGSRVRMPWPAFWRLRRTLGGFAATPPMSERKPETDSVDVVAFARQGATQRGDWPLTEMPRLLDSVKAAPASAAARWEAQGILVPVTGGEAEIWLHLRGSTTVELQCQRCLQGVVEEVVVDRRFRFVRDEAAAAKLDEESEDDVLVLPQRLDLIELLEDEFILALPLVPMHETCPQPLVAPAQADFAEEEAAPNPFAALAALRTRKAP
jgi:uncharacterized protein